MIVDILVARDTYSFNFNSTGWVKNDLTCFCQNFVKSAPNLIVFGTQMAKTIELCTVHSLSTSPNLCHY